MKELGQTGGQDLAIATDFKWCVGGQDLAIATDFKCQWGERR